MIKEALVSRQIAKLAIVPLCLFFISANAFSQDAADSLEAKKWNNSAVVLAIFTPDNSFLLPVAYINYKRWHIEPRYNYEDMQTFSTFVGYNFTGGKKLKYLLTPMLGGVVGQTDGIAPGFEADLGLGRFGFYTEIEYVFDLNASEDSYFYAWSQLKFSITKWLIVSLVGGRNRVYQNGLEVQRGVALGFKKGKNTLTGYYYNPFTPENYGSVAFFRKF